MGRILSDSAAPGLMVSVNELLTLPLVVAII
jgi:hypothetical protein